MDMKPIGVVLAALVVVMACGGPTDASHIPTPASGPATLPPSSMGPTPSAEAASPTPSTAASPTPTLNLPSATPALTAPVGPPLAQLIGQKLIVRMDGTQPTASLLGRIGRGEVGGVILFGANITTPAELSALTRTLRGAAAAGGQPPLLVAVDQEGGSIRRVPWAPPTLSTVEMGEQGSTSGARSQGTATGRALRDLGIDIDLAPVADVPASEDSFMYLEDRTWSFSASTTASLANAFAQGLESEGVVPVMKHFPGLGFATLNTDSHAVTITEPATALTLGLRPYQQAIAARIPTIMLSNATYTAYDPLGAAGWSGAIATTMLRQQMGFTGVTITDSLTGTAAARGVSPSQLAVSAAAAGADMILVTGSESSTVKVYADLMTAAVDGQIPRAALDASYDRILALKAGA